MSSTIYVLDCGDLFFQLFKAVSAFMKSSSYLRLIGLSAAFGFFIAIVRSFKSLNPNTIIKWFVMYMLVFNVVMIPKTDVLISDISSQKNYPVANVPTAFAFMAEAFTGLGFGLAQLFDSLFTTPDSLQYTKTGFLFGSKLIQEARDFRVVDPVLKADLSMYFNRCVVGNIFLTHVLSPTELKESTNIWESISKSPSKIRRTLLANEEGIREDKSCFDATPILKARLEAEMTKAYTIFGINLFGNPKNSNYKNLFETHLKSAFNYYQAMETTGTNAFLQAMMLNFIKEGVTDYQAHLNSTASIMSHEFSKSQVQQRYLWEIGGLKSAWLWPFFHSVVMFLAMALFPLIILLVIAYSGIVAFKSYLLFFLSLQFWPALFAVLNFIMSFYGSAISTQYGAINLANLDNIEQLHSEVGSVAGYMMVFIPWLAYGLVTKIGDSFNSLSHSMISGLQSSTMSAAGEAANASFSLGQTSFYNATGNTLSANKHDSNFTSMAGSTTRMLDSGAILTVTRDGSEVIDASSTISRGALSINSNKAISGMLNQAAESNTQAIYSQSHQLSSLVSQGVQQLTQFSELQGKDIRLGDGVSESDTAQVQHAVSNVLGIANSVAERTGVTTEQALTGIMNAGVSAQAGVNTNKSLAGKLMGFAFGVDGNLYARAGYDKSDSTSHRSNDGFEKVLDTKQMQDFRRDFSYLQNFGQTHHLDTAHSRGASLLSQGSSDLRQALNVSNNLDASLSQGERIATARQVTESGGATINRNLDQMFKDYVTDKLDDSERNYLYGHPGDPNAQAKLEQLANQFMSDEGVRNQLIDLYGNESHRVNPQARFDADKTHIQSQPASLQSKQKLQEQELQQQASLNDVGLDEDKARALQNRVEAKIQVRKEVNEAMEAVAGTVVDRQNQGVDKEIDRGIKNSHAKSIITGDK